MTDFNHARVGTILDVRELRRRAEARLSRDRPAPVDSTPHEVRGLIHELSVHQVELDLQNEQLLATHAELEEARNRYYDLYEEAPVAYLTISASGGLVSCNRLAMAQFALRPESFSRRQFLDLMAPAFHARFAEGRDRLTIGGPVESFEATMRRQDGTRFWATVHLSVARSAAGAGALFRVAVINVDERRQAEGRMARLAAIVASSNLVIFSHDLSGTVTSWNDSATQLFGYTSQEIIGQNSSVLLPAARKGEDVLISSRLARGERVSCDTIRVRDDGVPVPVGLTASPIFNDAGAMIGVSHVMRDNREQVASREALREQMDNLRGHQDVLETADRRKDDLIATLAHELRNPLAALRNASALLGHSAELDRHSREVIGRQVAQMSALLEDLLDITRVSQDRIPIRNDVLQLVEVLEYAVESTLTIFRSRQHHLQVECPEESLPIRGDMTRLVQVFGNLLSNAAKYTDRGGEIWLTVVKAGDLAEIRVRDEGIGIDADFLPRAFDLYSQAGPGIDRSEGGLGIGLFLVKKLVELHHGTVTVTSEGLGRGTQFTVRLPLLDEATPPAVP